MFGVPRAAARGRGHIAAVRAQERLRPVPCVAELAGVWCFVLDTCGIQLDGYHKLDAVRFRHFPYRVSVTRSLEARGDAGQGGGPLLWETGE